MGLDLAVGLLVLVAAIRGWLKGFVVQAIRLGGLVAAVYAAAPVRDQARPYAQQYLATIRPDLLDRMLWWVSAVVCYLVLVGVASMIVAVSRRQTFGLSEPNRGDQFAGFGVGLLKGLVVAAFLLGSLQKYATPYLNQVGWANEQARTSMVWDWNARYQPAAQIWAAPPVQHFVGQIQRMGINSPAVAGPPIEGETTAQVGTPAPKLSIPGGDGLGGDLKGLDPEFARAVESIRRELQTLGVEP